MSRFPEAAPATLTIPKALIVNRGPAAPACGHSFDAVINAMGEDVGRVEAMPAPKVDRALAEQFAGESDLQLDLNAMRRAGL